MLDQAFKLVARFRGEHWRLSEEEAYDLSRGIAGIWVFLPIPAEDSELMLAAQDCAAACIRVAGSRVVEDRLQASVRQVMAGNPHLTREQAEAYVLASMFAPPQPAQPQGNGNAAP